jgi:hypothetical protein
MRKHKTLKVVAAIAASFIALAGTIVLLAQTGTISPEMAKLMLAALLAIYIGFGFLIAVYRLIDMME